MDAHTEYYLPSVEGQAEQARLELQSKALYDLLGGQTVQSPLPSKPSLLVDVGCGTGAVSVSLSLRNPTAQVFGIDLARVPESHVTPPNLAYIQGNFLELAGKDQRLRSADLVFSRLLVAGFSQGKWAQYINAASSLLKPGGCLEIQDIASNFYREETGPNGEPIRVDANPEWMTLLRKEMFSEGMDPDCGQNAARHMAAAGLENIQCTEYKWTFGDWLKDREPNTAAIGLYARNHMFPIFDGLLERLLRGKVSDDRLAALKEQARETVQSTGMWAVYLVTTAQKPK